MYRCSRAGGPRSSPRSARPAGTRRPRAPDRGRRRRLPPQLLPRRPRAPGATIEAIRAAAERVGREVAVLGDLPGPKLRIGELRDDFAELETGMHVTLTPQRGRGRPARRSRSPGRGSPSLREDQLVYLADGAIRLRVARPRRRRRRLRGRGRRHALLPQGDEHPRRRRPAGRDRRRPRLGRVRGRAGHRPARRLLRLHRRRPRAGAASGCARSTPTSR